MSIRDAMINSLFLPESFYRRKAGFAYRDQAGFISPQAFGRNTYSDEEVGSVIHAMLESIKDPIRRFEWLKERGFEPGTPNRILALRCIRLAKDAPIRSIVRPIIGQWEVLYAIWSYEPDWYTKHQNILIPIWPPAVGYLGTRGMLLIVKEIADRRGLKTPLITAHPEHIQRCFFIARKIFGVAATDVRNPSAEWFDPESIQKWTTGPGRWLAYEMLARIHHRLHGWM